VHVNFSILLPPPGGIAVRRVCWLGIRWLVRSFYSSLKFVGTEFLENGWRWKLGSNEQPRENGIWRIEWSLVEMQDGGLVEVCNLHSLLAFSSYKVVGALFDTRSCNVCWNCSGHWFLRRSDFRTVQHNGSERLGVAFLSDAMRPLGQLGRWLWLMDDSDRGCSICVSDRRPAAIQRWNSWAMQTAWPATGHHR